MPPLGDPNAKRRNKESEFSVLVRDEDREVPEFPSAALEALPPDLHVEALAYWRETWVTCGQLLGEIDRFAVARAASLHVHIIELGVEVPGVMLTQLKALEDSWGANPRSRRQFRMELVDKDETPEAQADVGAGDSNIIEMASRRAG